MGILFVVLLRLRCVVDFLNSDGHIIHGGGAGAAAEPPHQGSRSGTQMPEA